MESINRLKFIIALTAILIAVSITFAIPTVYFTASYRYQANWLLEHANYSAESISELIYTSPDTWQFQDHRIQDILRRSHNDRSLHYRIVDTQGKEILEQGPKYEFVHNVSASLSDGINPAGKIHVAVDLFPLITETAFATLIGLTIAIVVFVLLHLLPFATLTRTTQSLIESRIAIANEMRIKEKALEEQRLISEKMRHQSLHDPLTGLANRKQFYLELNHLIESKQSIKDSLWIMIIDLDRFKEINDALGHQLGDEVLMEVARRLTSTLPSESLVARLGGDEFAILVKNKQDRQIEELLTVLQKNLSAHFNIHGYYLAIYASVGVAHFPQDGVTQEDLLRHADMAMYHAKNSSKVWAYYDHSIDHNTPNRLALIAELRQLLDQEKLEVYYQPKISLKTNTLIGFEALARWRHPEYGFISPDIFIQIAEQTSMIHDLTGYVLKTAMEQLTLWQQAISDQLTMSVNISAKNLQDEYLPNKIHAMLECAMVDPSGFGLEITETSMMSDPEQSRLIVQRLSELGIKIAIDDYGTGYSSLAYIKRLAVHQVKIDRSFVMNLISDNDDRIIVTSTVRMAHNLGLEVIAEGVENQATADFLSELGCEVAQGYHYCKPLSAEAMQDWFAAQKHLLPGNQTNPTGPSLPRRYSG